MGTVKRGLRSQPKNQTISISLSEDVSDDDYEQSALRRASNELLPKGVHQRQGELLQRIRRSARTLEWSPGRRMGTQGRGSKRAVRAPCSRARTPHRARTHSTRQHEGDGQKPWGGGEHHPTP